MATLATRADIKPANVLVGQFGEVVVIDWGLARGVHGPELDGTLDGDPVLAAGSPGPVMPADDRMETAAGTVVGTPAYMAPEQARGETVDERADVYAIGALLIPSITRTSADPTTTIASARMSSRRS